MSSLEASAATKFAIDEMQDIVRRSTRVHVCGRQTKSGMHPTDDGTTTLSILPLQGIVSYDPQEFVITMLSGTSVTDIVGVLFKHGQYLPFDPLLANKGATIGGTVAANASGSGRFRFGGIRDFLLGVRFIDGLGSCIRGGGQVVKNAAGFDYPKLMVGSQGKLGLVYEMTFKVFPRPESFATLLCYFSELNQALTTMNQLASSPLDIEAIDLVPVAKELPGYELAIRIGGIATAIPERLSRLQKLVPESRILNGHDDEVYWRSVSNFDWAHHAGTLLKLPTTPKSIPQMERLLADTQIERRYSVAGNVVWIATKRADDFPSDLGIAQTFLGLPEKFPKIVGPGPFGQAIKRALDPEMKFV